MQEIVIIGSGGHARSVLDLLQSINNYKIKGFWDYSGQGELKLGPYNRIQASSLKALLNANKLVAVGIGQLSDPGPRIALINQLLEHDAELPTLISPFAYISKSANLESGSTVMPAAVISSFVSIGAHCIINTGSVIEHDSVVEDFCHISTNATVNGGCRIGARTFIGSGAVLRQGIEVAQDSIIGAGSVLLNHTGPGETWVGNPARKLR